MQENRVRRAGQCNGTRSTVTIEVIRHFLTKSGHSQVRKRLAFDAIPRINTATWLGRKKNVNKGPLFRLARNHLAGREIDDRGILPVGQLDEQASDRTA